MDENESSRMINEVEKKLLQDAVALMKAENLSLVSPEELPQTDEPKKKPKPRVNCLQEMLLEIMDERKITLTQIQKETEIPWPTLMGWHDGAVGCQMADKNLLRLAQYFNVDLYYLLYGIGTDGPHFKNEEDETA